MRDVKISIYTPLRKWNWRALMPFVIYYFQKQTTIKTIKMMKKKAKRLKIQHFSSGYVRFWMNGKGIQRSVDVFVSLCRHFVFCCCSVCLGSIHVSFYNCISGVTEMCVRDFVCHFDSEIRFYADRNLVMNVEIIQSH